MPILSIENLSYTYPGGQKAALREENAAFEGGGKMYAITGPSGSGKSTLLSLLVGWRPPRRGASSARGQPQRRGAAAGGHCPELGVGGEGDPGGRAYGEPGRREHSGNHSPAAQASDRQELLRHHRYP